MIRALICLVLALGGFRSAAQDSIQSGTRAKAEYRIIFNFDFRQTFVNAEPVRFYGFRLGAQRGNDILAIGFYGLGDPYVQVDTEVPGIGIRTVHTDFDFTAFTYERLIINSKRWQVGVPLSLGLGNYRRGYIGDDGRLVPLSTNELVPLEATLHADYNLLWWFFIGVGGGYRHVLAADPSATRTLSDWTYYAKAGLRLGEVVKRARANGKRARNGSHEG